MRKITTHILCLTLALLTNCAHETTSQPSQSIPSRQPGRSEKARTTNTASTIQQERDDIYTLLAYSVVYKNWQTKDTKAGGRGHNIGSVLVNPEGKVVSWARNCNGVTSNGTQHGEVRLMTQYQSKNHLYDLKGYTVYTTLEPCAMCSGMMVMQSVQRTVYGQNDPGFGKAIERLNYKSAQFKPYPRPVISEPSPDHFRPLMEKKYETYSGGDEKKSITSWLRTSEAEELYKQATDEFLNYPVKFRENEPLHQDAVRFYQTVSSSTETR